MSGSHHTTGHSFANNFVRQSQQCYISYNYPQTCKINNFQTSCCQIPKKIWINGNSFIEHLQASGHELVKEIIPWPWMLGHQYLQWTPVSETFVIDQQWHPWSYTEKTSPVISNINKKNIVVSCYITFYSIIYLDYNKIDGKI